MALLTAHVERFNAGVRSGEVGPMVDWFTEDAELAFEGIPVGPFHGREAIAAAYRTQPPDDEIELLDVEQDGAGPVVKRLSVTMRAVERFLTSTVLPYFP